VPVAVRDLLSLTRFGHRAAFFVEGCGFFVSLTDRVCETPLRRTHRRRKPDSNFWSLSEPWCRSWHPKMTGNGRRRVVIVFRLDGLGAMSVVSGTQPA
jgi:hypothetical protein